MLRLSNRLGKYTFDLYPANPSGSEVLGHISRLLNTFAYITTGVITFVTLVFALLKMMVVANILLLVAAGWGRWCCFKATLASALNLRAGLNFLNTLLLPVIALLLANLDKLLALLP